MKKFQSVCISCVLLAIVSFGCASGPEANKKSDLPPLPNGVTLHRNQDVEGVWVAPGFDFKGYDALYVAGTQFKAIVRPNEKEMRERAVAAVQDEFVFYARASGLFKTVVTSTNDLPAGGKVLTLNNTIIEYEKGGGGARYFAGIFGAGQPVNKVRGLMYDGDKLVFAFEARRSGESPGARVAGVFMSDQEIQENDIRDLASDVVDCMKRIAGITKPE